MSHEPQTVDCPCCGETAPNDRAEDFQTPHGPVSVCRACHDYLTAYPQADTDTTHE